MKNSIKNDIKIGVVGGALASGLFLSQNTNARLPSRDAFYTQNVGEKIDTVLNLRQKTKIYLSGSTQMYNIFLNKIKVEQKFDYQVGKENKVDLFEGKTNLQFVAYLSIGKDTVLKLVADPNCKLCAIDTLKIVNGNISIENKNGEILEENLKSILKVKKEGGIYKVEFGLEKEFNTAQDAYSLLNLVLSYGEVYERHLNAIIGEFKNQKIDFLAFKGKVKVLDPIYEPTTATDYLELNFVYSPQLDPPRFVSHNDSRLLNDYGYPFFYEGSVFHALDSAYYWACPLRVGIDTQYLGLAKKSIIRVGEQYNNIEDSYPNPWDHDSELMKKIKDMQYSKYSINSADYDTTKWIMLDLDSRGTWPGVYLRCPPIFANSPYFGKHFKYQDGTVVDLVYTQKNKANSFYFFQLWMKDSDLKTEYPPKFPYVYPKYRQPPPRDSIKYMIYYKHVTFIFSADRGKDGVYQWLADTVLVAKNEGYGAKSLNEEVFKWETGYKPKNIPFDSISANMISENKLALLVPSKKQILILDENPIYKTIARDGFVKYNNLYLPKDTLPAKVVEKIPFDGETSVNKNTFIVIQFNESIKFVSMEIYEDGQKKELGGWTLSNGDSTLTCWTKESLADNVKVTYVATVQDLDSNKTEVRGYFYTANPAGVELENSLKDLEFREVEIYDLNARLIRRFESGEKIDISNLPTGTYIIKIVKENGEKIIELLMDYKDYHWFQKLKD